MRKENLFLFIICICFLSCKKSFEKKYHGFWAMTRWEFEFKEDNTYSRVSEGHYGFTTVTGEYVIIGDTIKLLSGFNNTHGTVNEKYLIRNDKIIDLALKLDYKEVASFEDIEVYYTSNEGIDITKLK